MDTETIYGELRVMNPWWLSGRVPGSQIKPFKRDAYFAVAARLKRYPDKAVLLRGPRQVGKTVLAYQVISDHLAENDPLSVVYVSYDRPTLRNLSQEDILRVTREIHGTPPSLLVLDEIQYLRDWDQWLKVFVDGKHGTKVLATGSSSLALKRGRRESGAGRWVEVLMFPLSFAEFVELRTGKSLLSLPFIREGKPLSGKVSEERWAIESGVFKELFREYVQKGGFPGVIDLDPWRAQDELRDILDKALFKDVAALMGKREPLALESLVYYLAKYPGSILVAEKLSEDLGLQRATLEGYLAALEDMMLLVRLPNLRGKTRRYKAYFADTALLSMLRGSQSGLLDDNLRGALLETVALANLRHFAALNNLGIFYWRSGDYEIDFVLTKAMKPEIAVEIKSGGKKLKGAARFYREYGVPVRVMGLTRPEALPEGALWVPIEFDLYRATSFVRQTVEMELARATERA